MGGRGECGVRKGGMGHGWRIGGVLEALLSGVGVGACRQACGLPHHACSPHRSHEA
ncbi:hypothetical protein BC827DRAFT_1248658 [Russula dissimulans]|nr:hypothetical protein BC827DRAFT_1248658 [Russula dissimulans]